MELAATTRHRRDIHAILAAALQSADAGRAVERVLRRDGDVLFVGSERLPLGPKGRLLVAGAGKAAAVMARAVAAVTGPLLAKGVVVGGPDAAENIPRMDLIIGTHPLPSDRSLAAAAAILDLVRGAGPDDVVLFLLSGGASAMLEAPIEGLRIEDLRSVTRALLVSGLPITELNVVRRALSAVKGGGIVRAAAPAFTQTLAVSDVVSDDPAVIGSAPTVQGVSDPARAMEVVRRVELPGRLEATVCDALARLPAAAAMPGNESRVAYQVIASVEDALRGAAQAAQSAGYETEIVSAAVSGEAREVGAAWARRASARASSMGTPCCLLAGGETTVRVAGAGRGGRNQEFTLAAGIALAGHAGVTVAAIGTDGRDGPTSVAGAIADGDTVERGRRLGNDAAGFLADNDSYTFFAGLDDLVTTGATRTNVMDLHIALIGLADD